MGIDPLIKIAVSLTVAAAMTGHLPAITQAVLLAQVKLLQESQASKWGSPDLIFSHTTLAKLAHGNIRTRRQARRGQNGVELPRTSRKESLSQLNLTQSRHSAPQGRQAPPQDTAALVPRASRPNSPRLNSSHATRARFMDI